MNAWPFAPELAVQKVDVCVPFRIAVSRGSLSATGGQLILPAQQSTLAWTLTCQTISSSTKHRSRQRLRWATYRRRRWTIRVLTPYNNMGGVQLSLSPSLSLSLSLSDTLFACSQVCASCHSGTNCHSSCAIRVVAGYVPYYTYQIASLSFSLSVYACM